MYVGSVRAMVVAGQEGAYGNAEKTAFVRTPLMMLSTLPRVLSIQEEITVPVNIFAMENQVKNVTVSLQASGGGVQIVGANQQSLKFSQPGDQLVFFTLKTGSKTGKATIHLTANGGGQQTKETIEIEVRNPNPIVTLRNSQWAEAGQSKELSYNLSSSSANNQIKLEVSRIPSVDISRRFDFLYNYQHHCTEQLTSKALPLLFVGQFKTIDKIEAEKDKDKSTGSYPADLWSSTPQWRICILAGKCCCRRMDQFLCRNVPDTGTRKRIRRSFERIEQVEAFPTCCRTELADAAGCKRLATMAVGIATGLPFIYACIGRSTGIWGHEPDERTGRIIHSG